MTNSDPQADVSPSDRNGSTVLIVGIGSPHGDDQLGWLVASELSKRNLSRCVTRLARTPMELLDWIEDCPVLHVIDACHGAKAPGSTYRWNWPCAEIASGSWSNTHDFNVVGVLALAEQLGQLPPNVVVWGIEIGSCGRSNDSLSQFAERWVGVLADQIQEELGHCY